MNRIKILFILLAGIAFASTPFIVRAGQVSPNPNTGTITVDTSGAYNSFSPSFQNNGVINITGTGYLVNWTELYNYAGGTLNNSGTLGNHAIGYLANYGTLNNYAGGTLDNSGEGMLDNDAGGTLNNSGTLFNGYNSPLNNGGTLNNYAGGTLTNGGVMSNSGTLYNYGTLGNYASTYNSPGYTNGTLYNHGTLNNYGSITGTGNYTQTAGQTKNNGSLSQTSIDIRGGILSGTGTITGNVIIGSGATVQPGDAPGTLTINGNFSSSGKIIFEIGGLGSGLYSVLDINGNAIFTGGNIEFDFINGYSPSAGNSWDDFLLANSITGLDTLSFNVEGLGSGFGYEFNPATGSFSISSVSSVPEPSTLALLGIVLALLGTVRRWKARAYEVTISTIARGTAVLPCSTNSLSSSHVFHVTLCHSESYPHTLRMFLSSFWKALLSPRLD